MESWPMGWLRFEPRTDPVWLGHLPLLPSADLSEVVCVLAPRAGLLRLPRGPGLPDGREPLAELRRVASARGHHAKAHLPATGGNAVLRFARHSHPTVRRIRERSGEPGSISYAPGDTHLSRTGVAGLDGPGPGVRRPPHGCSDFHDRAVNRRGHHHR